MKEIGMLFNTDMVRAILAGRKTQTRRFYAGNKVFQHRQPAHVGDMVYVRECWLRLPSGEYEYRADFPERSFWVKARKWHPSLHMPKAAARIWLRVTLCLAQRVCDITEDEAREEGVSLAEGETSYREAFKRVWCSIYGAESWTMYAYVIKFERVEK